MKGRPIYETHKKDYLDIFVGAHHAQRNININIGLCR